MDRILLLETFVTDDSAINEPGSDIRIDFPHRGDIRCRTLHIARCGSVFGNVVADEVRVSGRLVGSVHATRFFTAAGSKVTGSINCAVLGVKPGTDIRAYIGPEFPTMPFAAPAFDEQVERPLHAVVAEAVRDMPAFEPDERQLPETLAEALAEALVDQPRPAQEAVECVTANARLPEAPQRAPAAPRAPMTVLPPLL